MRPTEHGSHMKVEHGRYCDHHLHPNQPLSLVNLTESFDGQTYIAYFPWIKLFEELSSNGQESGTWSYAYIELVKKWRVC